MEIRKRLQDHIDRLFYNAPPNRAAFELKEELMANSMERYADLTARGMSDEEAYGSVIGSIGNVDELLAALPADDLAAQSDWELDRREHSAGITALSVGLYIFAGVVFFAGAAAGAVWDGVWVLIGLAVAAAICIVPTCLLVYNAYRWPKYTKKEETMVEDFKEWTADSKKAKSLRGAISSLLWTFTVAVYLIVSFTTFAWSITWMIFIIAAFVEAFITLLFRLKDMR